MNRWEDILPKAKTIEVISGRRKLKTSQMFYNLSRKDCLDSLRQSESEGHICFVPSSEDMYKEIYRMMLNVEIPEDLKSTFCRKFSESILIFLKGKNDK